MTTGLFGTARLGSTRLLPRKHLLPSCVQPLLAYLLKRMAREFAPELQSGQVKIVIVTSDEPENRDLDIFDEVTSGFRMNLGGIHLTCGTEPDIYKMI